MYPTSRTNVSAGDPAAACILIGNKEISHPCSFILFGLAFPISLESLAPCASHTHIALEQSGAEDKLLVFTFLLFPPLPLLFSMSPFPCLKVGTVYMEVFYNPNPFPRFQPENTPNLKSFKSTFLQFCHNINNFMSMILLDFVLSSFLAWSPSSWGL